MLLDPTNIRLGKGNSNQIVPIRLVMAGVISTPWHAKAAMGYLVNDFELAPAFATQTGLPYSGGISGSSSTLTVTPGAAVQNIINTGSFNGSGGADRVPITDRNAYQQPETYVVTCGFPSGCFSVSATGLSFWARLSILPTTRM